MLASPLTLFANASAASGVMQTFITPVMATLCTIASLVCVFFLINGGLQYMSSSGKPERLEGAKRTIRNALLGLVIVLAAATLTAILSHAYGSGGAAPTEKLPNLQAIEPSKPDGGLVQALIDGVIGFLRNIIESIGQPFVGALAYFVNSTPLMAENSSVFNLWLAVLAIADALFVVVVALLGFHVMSATTFGFEEIEIKSFLPQLALIFLLMNTSIFAIDAVISLSNGMINALQSGFVSTDIWGVLTEMTKKSNDLGVAGLLMMLAFIVLTLMLLIYYVARILALYIGAILAPMVLLVWLIPTFKDFSIAALKTYLVTIFVLFVHAVIWLLAASIFTGVLTGDNSGQPNTLMALLVGMATILTLLKTQNAMKEFTYAASVPRAAREISSQLVRSVSSIHKAGRGAARGYSKAYDKVTGAKSSKAKRIAATQPSVGITVTKATPTPAPAKIGETRKAERIEKK